jgi:hypothetical protein
VADLPLFEVEPVSYRMADGEDELHDLYRCPRADCRGEFEVEQGALVASCTKRGRGTAPCPFCFRVSRVPGTMGEQQEFA